MKNKKNLLNFATALGLLVLWGIVTRLFLAAGQGIAILETLLFASIPFLLAFAALWADEATGGKRRTAAGKE